MTRILVIAPHPDDETLGCGGTLLRYRIEGAEIHWLIVTEMPAGNVYSPARREARDREIGLVADAYGFASVDRLGFPAAGLEAASLDRLVGAISTVVKRIEPEILFAPFAGDAHSDHRATFAAVAASSKWFRNPSVRRILAYEVLSETDSAIDPTTTGFRPNVFVNVGATIDAKLRIARLYAGEMGEFPFPRSEPAIRALASVRGAAAGVEAAEAFMLLKEIV